MTENVCHRVVSAQIWVGNAPKVTQLQGHKIYNMFCEKILGFHLER